MSQLRERAVATLSQREWMDDDVLLYLMRSVLCDAATCTIIDPIVMAAAVDRTDKKSRGALARDFVWACAAQKTVLVPVFESAHWSLMVYRAQWDQWYFCDSLRTHHRRHLQILALLAETHCIQAVKSRVFIYNDLPVQPESYECARYVLFYTLAFLSVFTRHAGELECRDALEHELRKVSEVNRGEFERRLVAVLTQ